MTGEGAGAEALLAAARALPPLDRIVFHAGSASALPPAHPARATGRSVSRHAAGFRLSWRDLLFAGHRSETAFFAPSPACDIVDGTVTATPVCALSICGAGASEGDQSMQRAMVIAAGSRRSYPERSQRRRMVRLWFARQVPHRMWLLERRRLRERSRQRRHVFCRSGLCCQCTIPPAVMAGLVPAIHDFASVKN